MSSKAYHDELNYLRTLGVEYAQRHPTTAGALGAGARDPDVERLLQGFAFLTARLHERLDNQYSHVAEALLEVAWPQVLQPLPSVTMIQFNPDRQVLRKDFTLEKGVELDSEKQSWGSCRFQTSRSLTLYPFQIGDVKLIEERESAILDIEFTVNSGASIADCALGELPLYISGDDTRFTYGWYLWLTQFVKSARLFDSGGEQFEEVQLAPVGYDDDITILPDSDAELPGHRLLREFFLYPKNFLFVKVVDLSPLQKLDVTDKFKLRINFGTKAPSGPMRRVEPGSFKLFCTPAVNLFKSHSRLTHDHTRSEFVVRSDEIDIEHHEVFSVDEVIGIESGPSGKRREILPFFQQKSTAAKRQPTFRTRFADIQVRRNDRALLGRECFVTFEDLDINVAHSISMDITCCNRAGAATLKPGQISKPSEMIPAFVQFRNIDQPTAYRPAVAAANYLWQLVASMNVARQTAADIENIRSAIRLHCRVHLESDAAVNQWIEGISGISVTPGVSTDNGTILRTMNLDLDISCPPERSFEFYLFSIIICEYVRHISAINTRLNFKMQFNHDVSQRYDWPKRMGSCPVI